MSRFYSYLNTAAHIIQLYKGELPLAIFLKQFFAKEKKYGSKDRKQIAALCYAYFRIAAGLKPVEMELALQIAVFLCENKPNPFLQTLKPEWNDLSEVAFTEKLEIVKQYFDYQLIFPLKQQLSPAVNQQLFVSSLLTQPDLFIRVRPTFRDKVLKELDDAGVQFTAVNEDCLALQNATKLPENLILNQHYVVQDASSQKVGNILKNYLGTNLNDKNIWDCCAASGGKSIMLHDAGFIYNLYVSDIRASILNNLKSRFETAGIKKYTSFVADLTSNHIKAPISNFDVIIADVPCSGSGTWGRTPEQLSFFGTNDLNLYTSRQKSITANLIPFLKTNGIMIYITCSIFTAENEAIVAELTNNNFELMHSETILGYKHKADSMFLAILKKK
jgi:16S rRNA (cytosine967-C5)-methyltransferase